MSILRDYGTGCLQLVIIISTWSFDVNAENLHVRKDYPFPPT